MVIKPPAYCLKVVTGIAGNKASVSFVLSEVQWLG
jgi:hypothetical protein